jgi:hypothetical protein
VCAARQVGRLREAAQPHELLRVVQQLVVGEEGLHPDVSSKRAIARSKAHEQLGDLLGGRDQRRAERDRVAIARTIRPCSSANSASCAAGLHRGGERHAPGGSAASSIAPIRPTPRTSATCRRDAYARNARLELRCDGLHVREDVLVFVDLQRLERDRARDRVARVGEAMAEGADPAAVGSDGRVHLLGHHHAEIGA